MFFFLIVFLKGEMWISLATMSTYNLILGQQQALIPFISIIQSMGNIFGDRSSKVFQCLHFTCQIFWFL